MADCLFSEETFACLTALSTNNNSDWFQQYKQEYEETVRNPALNFIAGMANDVGQHLPPFSGCSEEGEKLFDAGSSQHSLQQGQNPV